MLECENLKVVMIGSFITPDISTTLNNTQFTILVTLLRYFAIRFVFVFGIFGFSCSQPKIRPTKTHQKIGAPPTFEQLPPKIEFDENMCAKTDNQRNTFQLKQANHECVLRGSNAHVYLANVHDKNLCKTLDIELSCPAGTKTYHEIGLENTRLKSCAIACVGEDRKLNGPFIKVFPPKESMLPPNRRIYSGYGRLGMKYQHGNYKKNIKTGRWERGRWTCESCKKIVRRISNYNDDGKLHGRQFRKEPYKTLKEIYSNGELVRRDEFRNGKPKAITRYSGSRIVKIKKWDGDKSTERVYNEKGSKITFYNKSGEVTETGQYNNKHVSHGRGEKIGEWREFYKPGVLQTITNYNKQGERHGLFRYHDKSGAEQSSGTYSNGKRIGEWRSFYPTTLQSDGRRLRRTLESYDESGVPDGRFCHWTKDGKLIRCFSMKAGTGKMYSYSYVKNWKTKLNLVTMMVDNKKHGKEITFKRGKKYSEVEWRKGKKHGLSIQYFAAHIRQQYKNGKREGKSCRSTKSSLWYGEFCNDKKCGTWIYQKPKETVERSYDGFGEEKYPTPKNASYDCPPNI